MYVPPPDKGVFALFIPISPLDRGIKLHPFKRGNIPYPHAYLFGVYLIKTLPFSKTEQYPYSPRTLIRGVLDFNSLVQRRNYAPLSQTCTVGEHRPRLQVAARPPERRTEGPADCYAKRQSRRNAVSLNRPRSVNRVIPPHRGPRLKIFDFQLG